MIIRRLLERARGASGEADGEGIVLRAVFYALAAASALMLALDLGSMTQNADVAIERTEPFVTEPPRDDDQVRPYYPKAAPRLPGRAAPRLPGLDGPPTPRMLGERMTFHRDGAGAIAAVGRIEPGTAADFDRALAEAKGAAKRVSFHSPGGSVGDAMAMARAIRKAGLATAVETDAYCASSCPLAFAGGVSRHAGTGAWIGVHQVFTLPSEAGTLQQGLADAQRISALCQQHLDAMGIDPRAWIHAMGTPKERLYVFKAAELKTYKFVTGAT